MSPINNVQVVVRQPPKHAHTRLTLSEKMEAGRLLKLDHSAEHIMKNYRVSRRTVTNISSNIYAIMKKAQAANVSMHAKTMRSAQFRKLETQIMHFISLACSAKMPVTHALISAKALCLKEELLKQDISADEASMLESFTASRGWTDKFVRRHSLRSVALHGEAGSVDVTGAAGDIVSLREKLPEYEPSNIFNVDETGLFFKLLPRRTYICKNEHKTSVRGTKAMKAKDRITAYVGTNADGTCKLPMAIIGKPMNQRWFRLRTPPAPYFSQRNAWFDSVTFKKWFYNLFIPFVRSKTSKPVVLLMDNCGPHGTDIVDHTGQIQIITFPPNCTAVHQPMDLGIIASWKSEYRHCMLRKIVMDIEHRSERREISKAKKRGTRGIGEGYDPHMLDVAEMVFDTWREVTQQTIVRCWNKADILPREMQASLAATHGKMRNSPLTIEKRVLDDIMSMMRCLSINICETDPLELYRDEGLICGAVEEWIEVETQSTIREGILNDAMDDAVELDGTLYNNESDCADDDVESNDRRMFLPVQNSLKLSDMFINLESLAYECDVSEAAMHLRKAKQAFISARAHAKKHDTRQAVR